MEKCKFCQAELEEGVTLCPACGKDNAQAAAEETAPAAETSAGEETAAAAEETAAEETAAEETAAEETAAAEIKPGVTQVTPGKLALAVAAVVVLLALLAALVLTGLKGTAPAEETVPSEAPAETQAAVEATYAPDGDPGNVTCKGTYTASDEEAAAAGDTVVATVGGRELTNGQLQVYYWLSFHSFLSENYMYAPYFGLDYNQPLDTQPMSAELHQQDYSMTWQQYFLRQALNDWHQVQALAVAAEAAGVEMDPEDQKLLETMRSDLEANAASYEMTLEDFICSNLGAGATYEDYEAYQRLYFQAAPYYQTEVDKLVPTEEDLEAYFTGHEQELAASGITKDTRYVAVRHILVTPKSDTEGATTFTEEEWKAAETSAQALLDQWLAGEKTEESFGALASEHSEDPGSKADGGLYPDVYEGQMVQAFNDWCFDTSRQHGDYGLVKTEYGYHIMFFVSTETDVWKVYAENGWITEKSNALLDSTLEAYPMEVFYDRILLGLLPEE